MKNIFHLIIITLFFNITLQAQEVILDIPFVPDYGNTFSASCIVMMLKYYNSNISFNELLIILGTKPLLDYDAVDEWVKAQYNLRFKRYDNSSIQDIIDFIDKGYPVMVLQQFSAGKEISIYRIVVGYNLENKEFILTDPSMQGKVYRISFILFQTLVELFLQNSQGWNSFFFWSVHPAFFPDDVILDVPFEPNHGQTCAASCMTMVLKYFGLNISFEDVIHNVGIPPLIDYESFNQWINDEWNAVFLEAGERHTCFCHLHEREKPLLHSGASRGCENDQGETGLHG